MGRWGRLETLLRTRHGPLLAGIDEVGRGPLAGPVVACAIVMPAGVRAIAGVNDSKQLDPPTRERLAVRIREVALAIGVGAASVREIDQLNILHATVRAMQRAIAACTRQLGQPPDHILIDGKPLRWLGIEHTAQVKGDASCYSVACASIVAKVTRDELMRRLAERHDGYGWTTNMGYGTPAHRTALHRLGLTAHHRRSFCESAQTSLELV
jgi:ribonuclease HII